MKAAIFKSWKPEPVVVKQGERFIRIEENWYTSSVEPVTQFDTMTAHRLCELLKKRFLYKAKVLKYAD